MSVGAGHTTAAITFVNALPTGVGSAAGISLGVDAEVELTRTADPGSIVVEPEPTTPLIRATLLEAVRRFGPPREYEIHLRLKSRIPAARGLKSSSAVSTAIGLAVAAALNRSVAPGEVAQIAADVSQRIGLSATGAYDDALASISSGIVVTDNGERKLLRHDPTDPSWAVVLWIPRSEHPPSASLISEFASRAAQGRAAEDLARQGRYLEAMGRNTELVEAALGYDYRPLREELRRQGALAAGVSGMGPAVAAIVPRERVSSCLRALPVGIADRWVVPFVSYDEGPGVG